MIHQYLSTRLLTDDEMKLMEAYWKKKDAKGDWQVATEETYN